MIVVAILRDTSAEVELEVTTENPGKGCVARFNTTFRFGNVIVEDFGLSSNEAMEQFRRNCGVYLENVCK